MKHQGLSSTRRKSLSQLLALENGAITIDRAAQTLQWEREKARIFLSSLHRSGWLKLIKPGLYVPVPLEAEEPELTHENSFVLSSYLFGECYIGGWSAASFWSLTDQLFLKIWVLTTQIVRKKEVARATHTYSLKHIGQWYYFGLYTEWIGQDRIFLSDPHKTVIDFANFIEDYGVQGFVDVFTSYLKSDHKNLPLLLDYAYKAKNRTVFKRLGFMLEKLSSQEESSIQYCLQNLSKGYSKFAPNIPCEAHISKWKLKVPSHMVEK